MSQIKRVLFESLNPETMVKEQKIRPVAIEELAAIEAEIAELETARDRLKALFIAEMTMAGVTTVESGRLMVAYTPPRVNTIFDSKRFKEEQGMLYNMYTKPSTVKESLRISWKASTVKE